MLKLAIHFRSSHRRGTALVGALWVIIALAAVILVFARSMNVEFLAAKQHISLAKCDMAETGVEQYVVASVNAEHLAPGYLDTLNLQAREIGDCYFWIISTNPEPGLDNESIPVYAITDEASKLDLNSITYDQLQALENMSLMTEDLATSIMAWRAPIGDPNADTTGNGPDDTYYMSLPNPYHMKQAPFENIEELKLLKGYDPALMYSIDINQSNTIDASELNGANSGASFDVTMRGLASYVTVYGIRATNLQTTTQPATDPTTGATTTTAPSAQNPVDINAQSTTAAPGGGRAGRGGGATVSNPQLQSLLQQYLPSTAAQLTQATNTALAAGPFTSVWDWANKVNINSADFGTIFTLLTCKQPATTITNTQTGVTTSGPALVGRVNIYTATKPVLMAIGFLDSDVDSIQSYIANNDIDPTDKANIAWLLDAVDDRTVLTTVGPYITGSTTIYSADIVVVSKDGRAYRRARIVVDASMGNPQIIFRRDMTSLGWPLDPAILASLRSGQGLLTQDNNTASRNNGLSLGLK